VKGQPVRPTQDIVSHIEKMIRSAVEKPNMYAPSVEQLEATLLLLDNLLSFCVSAPGENSDGLGGYTRYLIHLGYGSASYCERRRLDGMPSPHFDELAALFSEYMSTQYWPVAQRNRST
jgi:hypothetical protein